jgi:TonB family protein
MGSHHSRNLSLPCASNSIAVVSALMLAVVLAAGAQAPPVPSGPNSPLQGSTHKPNTDDKKVPDEKPVSEEDLRNQLQGKTFYLRGGYTNNDLRFDLHGKLVGNSPQASHTLSMVKIDKVHLSKYQLKLEGIRYAIHFQGAELNEDPTAGSEKLRISPKKKFLRITIQREESAPKRKKPKHSKDVPDRHAPATTQADANRVFEEAVNRVFAADIDERMIASLPDYWQLYYRAAAAKSAYKPSDPAVLRQSMVDQKARLLTTFEPPSNEFAEKAGIVGVAQYHVVVDREGRPAEIAVGQPIGFGLDESAIASIRKAAFQPAMKDGKPVPVLLDLLVQFRIYSNRTGATGANEAASAKVSEPEAPPLPGPYSANQPASKQP